MNRETYLALRRALSNRSWSEVDALLQKFEKGPNDRQFNCSNPRCDSGKVSLGDGWVNCSKCNP